MELEGDNEYESLPDDTGVGAHLLAGGLAGMCEHLLMFPVDVVKTRMQKLRPDPRYQYKGPLTALVSIYRTEGPSALFRGITVVAMGAGPAHALYFAAYEKSKVLLGASEDPSNHPLATGASAIIATLTHDAFMNPVEVVKQRLQVQGSPYINWHDCVRKVWHSEGFFAFYRSFTTQLLMNIPYQMTHLVSYEFFRNLTNPSNVYSPSSHMISGACAGALAAAITTPFDVAKTLLNTQETCPGAQAATNATLVGRRYVVGVLAAMRTIYEINGIQGFAKGLSARVLISAPSAAISWTVYEFFKHILRFSGSNEK